MLSSRISALTFRPRPSTLLPASRARCRLAWFPPPTIPVPLASGVPSPPCCFFAWRGKAEISAHPWDLGSSASSSSSLAAAEVIAPRHLLHRLGGHSLLPQRYQQVRRRLLRALHSRSPPE